MEYKRNEHKGIIHIGIYAKHFAWEFFDYKLKFIAINQCDYLEFIAIYVDI